MNTFTAQVVQAQTRYNSRFPMLASLALSAVLTLAMLAGVNSLAVMDAPAPVLAHSSSTSAS